MYVRPTFDVIFAIFARTNSIGVTTSRMIQAQSGVSSEKGKRKRNEAKRASMAAKENERRVDQR